MINAKIVKLRLTKALLFLLITAGPIHISAQDIRSAYMQVKWLHGYTYTVDYYLFTYLPNTTFRPDVLIFWGGGDSATLQFVQSSTSLNIVQSRFSGKHTYSGPGNYTIYGSENYRVGGIKNINTSQNEPEVIFNYLNIDQFGGGPNNAPLFQNPPVYFGLNGNMAFYDPQFSDPDGDSLSYTLVNCNTSNYYLPSGVSLSPAGVLSFSKDSLGLYAFSYQVKEWRKDFDGNYQNVGVSQMDFVMDINASIGIKEEFIGSAKLHPNPVSDVLFLEASDLQQIEKAEILNSLGEKVLEEKNSDRINVANLASGCYLVNLHMQGGKIHRSKFIKE